MIIDEQYPPSSSDGRSSLSISTGSFCAIRGCESLQTCSNAEHGHRRNPPCQCRPGSGLAKQSQNPVAALMSFPIQNNFDVKVGPDNGFRYTGNIQPVIPGNLSAK